MILNLEGGRTVQLAGLPAGATRTITNLGNNTIYYAPYSFVSAVNNVGSVAPRTSVILSVSPTYLVSPDGESQVDDQITVGSTGVSGYPKPTGIKTSAYTASNGDLVPCDASGGAFAVTAPTAAIGAMFGITKVDTSANPVTAMPMNIGTVTQGTVLTFICLDGTNWSLT